MLVGDAGVLGSIIGFAGWEEVMQPGQVLRPSGTHAVHSHLGTIQSLHSTWCLCFGSVWGNRNTHTVDGKHANYTWKVQKQEVFLLWGYATYSFWLDPCVPLKALFLGGDADKRWISVSLNFKAFGLSPRTEKSVWMRSDYSDIERYDNQLSMFLVLLLTKTLYPPSAFLSMVNFL